MSEIKVDAIGPRVDSGTLTIGAAGDTVNIAGTAGTGFPSTTINNNAANRVITGSGTVNTLNGQGNLLYNGEQLTIQETGAATDNLLVKTTGDNQISMALEKSDLKYDLGLDHNNDGSQNFYIRERSNNGVTTNSKRIVIDNSGAVTMPLQPAFFAYLNSDQAVSSSSRTTITVDAERWDNNADFNTGSYTFTAPVTGRYQFNVGEGIYNLASGTNGAAFLATSNRDYIFRGDVSANLYSFYGGSIIVDMDANDTALIQVQSQADTSYIVQGDYKTTFSGFLVC